jgi:hypothetical protein
MGTLAGEPIPNAEVVCTYTENGRAQRQTARTDKNGSVRFAVPLKVEVTIAAQGETKTVTCTPDKPRQGVAFGYQGHDPTQDKPPADGDSPYLTGEAGFER